MSIMINDFLSLHELLINQCVILPNKKINKAVQDYEFLYISDKSEFYQNIYQKVQESKVMVINYCQEVKEKIKDIYLIICFRKTIILIQNNFAESLLQTIFSINSKLEICFLRGVKTYLNQNTIINFKEICIDHILKEEIENFNQHLKLLRSQNKIINYIWKNIQPCIAIQLIKESYLKLNNNRIGKFNQNICNSALKIIDENEYIELRRIGVGYSCETKLIYMIEEEKLCVIKKITLIDSEGPKLLKRETENYLNINHPYLPKFYGVTKNEKFLIIEFINGKSLLNIKALRLNEKDKITIIFQLFSIFEYLHDKKYIYRDLKPDNILINENKTIVLVDFDRMIKKNSNEEHTKSFSSSFIAPEIEEGNIYRSSDIFSIGQMIYFLICEKNPNIDITINLKDLNEFPEFQKIYADCVKKYPEERPKISQLLDDFIILLQNKKIVIDLIESEYQYQIALKLYKSDIYLAIHYFKLASNQNNGKAHIFIGILYYKGQYIKHSINKAIYYFMLASDQNYAEAQFNLGIIYYKAEYVSRDINKAIYYFKLASNQNHMKAQFNLGMIYYNGKYISRDINKAIYYYTLASNQNYAEAQYILGIIYLEGEYVSRDINKAIYYFKLASNQNYAEAQFNLGVIYYNGKYVSRDINKAIYYFKLASNQNYAEAQYNLGIIYFNDESISRDINKAIYYFKLASNQNYAKAQFNLGVIYLENQYIERDIEKAIYYFTLASNQNDLFSQINLASIYHEGYYVPIDINKAIYYYSLASNQNHVNSQFNLGVIYLENQYIARDINKAIYYFTLASNQNDSDAQYNLGQIYWEGKYIARDINKAIYYYTLAANQNQVYAQYNLGYIYYKSYYIPRDINKAIYYFTLASNQNFVSAQFHLGMIFYKGEYISEDINKAIHYFTLASNQNDPESYYYLGLIYSNERFSPNINKAIEYYKLASEKNFEVAQHLLGVLYLNGEFIKKDINKGIYYISQSANQNFQLAQLHLGYIYFERKFIQKDINKAMYWFMRSVNNNCIEAYFVVGYFYHEGKYIERNIKQAIHFYKEASTFNRKYAKNNLGIIYKNGFYPEIPKNLNVAKIYFKEAIKRQNDIVSMYNLAHIYIFEECTDKSINKSIQLLIRSSEKKFSFSVKLLSLVLVKKCGFDKENIKNELENSINDSTELLSKIVQIIQINELNIPERYESFYEQFKNIDFLYDQSDDVHESQKLILREITPKSSITAEFYEGFGL